MIDFIHDIAGAYRELIYACSYPGEKVSVEKFCMGNTIETPMRTTTLLFALSLLDVEVTFAVVGEKKNQVAKFLKNLTYAKEVSYQDADFIFILKEAKEEEKIQAIQEAKIGTLTDPHCSATVLCEVESIEQGEVFLASGSGILEETVIEIEFFRGWDRQRQIKNKEFPLGIDFYLLDSKYQLIALPRTTKLKRREE